MTYYLVYDAVILAILVLFAALGWRKGLLLSLCGLVVVILSFLGAGFVADTLTPPIAKAVEPKLAAVIEENLSDRLTAGTSANADPIDDLRDMGGLYAWAADPLEDARETMDSLLLDTAQGVAQSAAQVIAVRLAHCVLFAVAFVLLLVLLTLLLHALNLVAKLPGLHFCNGLGGGIIGLAKGVLILFVAVACLQLFSKLITPQAVADTYLLKFFVVQNPILSLFQ